MILHQNFHVVSNIVIVLSMAKSNTLDGFFHFSWTWADVVMLSRNDMVTLKTREAQNY